ncbi:MAG TPA: hypothetical protein VIU11_21835 [Nakamurella sp.]
MLDDLQWTDGSTIDLWHYLTGRATPGPLLLLGAYRHDDVGSDQAAALGRLGGAVERIPLGGLSPGEVADLARSIAGGSRGAGWAAEVHRRTGGQPYLVRELAHAVAAGADASEIPVAVHEAVAQRVARVSSDAAALLAAASVAGSGWTGDILADLVGEEPDRVAELLDEAAAAGLVSGLRFTHDIVREAVYDALPGPRRIDLHHRAALALVRRDAPGRVRLCGRRRAALRRRGTEVWTGTRPGLGVSRSDRGRRPICLRRGGRSPVPGAGRGRGGRIRSRRRSGRGPARRPG